MRQTPRLVRSPCEYEIGRCTFQTRCGLHTFELEGLSLIFSDGRRPFNSGLPHRESRRREMPFGVHGGTSSFRLQTWSATTPNAYSASRRKEDDLSRRGGSRRGSSLYGILHAKSLKRGQNKTVSTDRVSRKIESVKHQHTSELAEPSSTLPQYT